VRERIDISTDRMEVHLCRLGPEVGPPALLVPGLGASPLIFELQPDRPLTELLRAGGRTPWAVDFHVNWRRRGQDSSALVGAVEDAIVELAALTGHPIERTVGIGHSLGGMLLLALACDGVPFEKLVMLGTGLDLREGASNLTRAIGLAPIGRAMQLLRPRATGVPIRGVARLTAPLSGRRIASPFERDQFFPGTTDGAVIRHFVREAVRDLSIPLLMDLAALFTEGGLHLGTDAPLKEAVRSLDLPVLFVAARQDKQMPLAAVRDAADRVPGARLIEVGIDERGRGYGHVDLLSGRDAAEEVLLPVVAFLDAQDRVREAS
jgi:pimeloyl-ACP methyl ester carboxylesterase